MRLTGEVVAEIAEDPALAARLDELGDTETRDKFLRLYTEAAKRASNR